MEEKIINNVLYGFPFTFPFWRAPLDAALTLDEATAENKLDEIPGMDGFTAEQQKTIVKNLRVLFAVYASGDKTYPQWSAAKQAVRAFPNSYKQIMGIRSKSTSWLPKLI